MMRNLGKVGIGADVYPASGMTGPRSTGGMWAIRGRPGHAE